MNNLAVYASHDSSVCCNIGDEYRIFEIERIAKKRYYSLQFGDMNAENIYKTVYQQIDQEFGSVKFENCYYVPHCFDNNQLALVRNIFGVDNFILSEHHMAHAAAAFYQSNYDESIIISYDGGGYDFDGVTCFVIYHAKCNKITKITKINRNFGVKYNNLARPIKEITKNQFSHFANNLSWAGKFMGLAGYGKIDSDLVRLFRNYFNGSDIINFRGHQINCHATTDILSEQDSYDFAANAQLAFEEEVYDIIKPYIDQYNLPICLTGGCALNVLFNERLRKITKQLIYVPPNPNDCGLSFGMVVDNTKPLHKNINIVYNGVGILDIDRLADYKAKYNAKEINCKEIAELLKIGKIIGLVYGRSECGPRALGNRSIICDPGIPNMKDILNSKVKFREWFRPFAPFVKLENCNKYFEFDLESKYMSFAPNVRSEYLDQMKAIAHVDGTARVQTITEKDHSIFYNILTAFESLTGRGVLLNTSFNIKGNPILTTIEDALNVLETTELDYVVIENILFGKNK